MNNSCIPIIEVDFNELIDEDLLFLSKDSLIEDISGIKINLEEGMDICVYSNDNDDMDSNPGHLISFGRVELNSEHMTNVVKWNCRLTTSINSLPGHISGEK